MIRPLALGQEQDRSPALFDPEKMEAHALVTGQSGCGKTSFLARLIEEILLSDAGSVLLLDCNLDFARFCKAIGRGWPIRKAVCVEDGAPEFRRRWSAIGDRLNTYGSARLKLPLRELGIDEWSVLLDAEDSDAVGARWLLELLWQEGVLPDAIATEASFTDLFRDIPRWAEGRLTTQESEWHTWMHHVPEFITSLDRARLARAGAEVVRSPLLAFSGDPLSPDATYLGDDLARDLRAETCFVGLDMLTFPLWEQRSRDFGVRHLIRALWDNGREEYAKRRG